MEREELLQRIRDAKLSGQTVTITYAGSEAQSYTLGEMAGSGGTSVTFRGIDRFNSPHAIKLVPKAYYGNHSIEAELTRVRKLPDRFSHITWYGEPDFGKKDLQP